MLDQSDYRCRELSQLKKSVFGLARGPSACLGHRLAADGRPRDLESDQNHIKSWLADTELQCNLCPSSSLTVLICVADLFEGRKATSH